MLRVKFFGWITITIRNMFYTSAEQLLWIGGDQATCLLIVGTPMLKSISLSFGWRNIKRVREIFSHWEEFSKVIWAYLSNEESERHYMYYWFGLLFMFTHQSIFIVIFFSWYLIMYNVLFIEKMVWIL